MKSKGKQDSENALPQPPLGKIEVVMEHTRAMNLQSHPILIYFNQMGN